MPSLHLVPQLSLVTLLFKILFVLLAILAGIIAIQHACLKIHQRLYTTFFPFHLHTRTDRHSIAAQLILNFSLLPNSLICGLWDGLTHIRFLSSYFSQWLFGSFCPFLPYSGFPSKGRSFLVLRIKVSPAPRISPSPRTLDTASGTPSTFPPSLIILRGRKFKSLLPIQI